VTWDRNIVAAVATYNEKTRSTIRIYDISMHVITQFVVPKELLNNMHAN
jgi:hypothetical protein